VKLSDGSVKTLYFTDTFAADGSATGFGGGPGGPGSHHGPGGHHGPGAPDLAPSTPPTTAATTG
jgi:hypothetical protein